MATHFIVSRMQFVGIAVSDSRQNSCLGQDRPIPHYAATSAFHPILTVEQTFRDGKKVPIADMRLILIADIDASGSRFNYTK